MSGRPAGFPRGYFDMPPEKAEQSGRAAPPTPPPESCETCRFRKEIACRRYPPQVGERWPDGFPVVSFGDWCGEWRGIINP